VKEGTLKFLTRCLSTSPAPIESSQIKAVSEAVSSLLEDSFEAARNEAAMALGTLMKMVGERPLNPILDGLADVRKAKIKEAYEKATVKCKSMPAGKPVSKPPPKPEAKPASRVTPKLAAKQSAATEDIPSAAPEMPVKPAKPVPKAAVRVFIIARAILTQKLYRRPASNQRLQRHRPTPQRSPRLPRRLKLPKVLRFPQLPADWIHLSINICQKMLKH
jgi:hypothetical protein